MNCSIAYTWILGHRHPLSLHRDRNDHNLDLHAESQAFLVPFKQKQKTENGDLERRSIGRTEESNVGAAYRLAI